MQSELGKIIERLDIDYEYLNKELLCFSGSVYCAYENSTDTFKNDVIKYIDSNIQDKEFFSYVLSCYKEYEMIEEAKASDEIINSSFTISKFKTFSECNCLRSHYKVISIKNIDIHIKMDNAYKKYGMNYLFSLKNAESRRIKANKNLIVIESFTNANELYSFINKNYFWKLEHPKYNQKEAEAIEKNFIYYHIMKLLIEKYKRDIPKGLSANNVDVQGIVEAYKYKGISIKDDVQFAKYKLISLNDNVKMQENGPFGALYDDRIDGKLQTHTSLKILKIFKCLMREKLIKNIALKPMKIIDSDFGLESIERGAPLRAKIKGLPKVSCFFDKSYENKLIIIHSKEKQEVTFEELRDDYQLEGDCVVTQVIHLKYNNAGDEYFIEHLDHEYILYHLDEYENKEKDITQKGSVDKIKTFKIDNSAIPFFYRYEGSYFLFLILEEYFINKELLKEYFEEVNYPDTKL